MYRQIRPALIVFALLTLLTGVVYPLVVTGLAQVAFPSAANGSIIDKNGDLVGSALIGQNFSDPRYFWGRPSATSGSPYTPFDAIALTGSSGSNLGPLSQALVDAVQERVDALQAADPGNPLPIPVDLVTASASGLDPHISVAAAYYQVARVARLRGMSQADVAVLVDQYTEGRTFGLLGEPRVNVLLLNLALDEIK
jgi:potassium-transporting ATPase KdpC subunit